MSASVSSSFRALRPTSRLLVLLLGMSFAALPAVAQDRLSHVISVLEADGVAIGTITSALAAPGTYETLRDLPLDWVFIDMEHGPFDPTALRSILASFVAPDGTVPVTPIVRIPANCSEVEFTSGYSSRCSMLAPSASSCPTVIPAGTWWMAWSRYAIRRSSTMPLPRRAAYGARGERPRSGGSAFRSISRSRTCGRSTRRASCSSFPCSSRATPSDASARS